MGTKSQFGQVSLYCNLFYSTFSLKEIKTASCFLNVFCSFEQIALQCFYIQSNGIIVFLLLKPPELFTSSVAV